MANSNGDLWAILFDKLGERALKCHLVRAHLAAHVGAKIEPWEFVVNSFADAVASDAAALAAVSADAVQHVTGCGYKAKLVLERLLAIDMFGVTQDRGEIKFRPRTADKPKLPTRQETIQVAKRAVSHRN